VNGNSASLLTALRGPVLLITLGVLFAIDYAGGVSVGRTWPALLIVVGLFKLAEHMAVKNS
jgi:uncharacterized protein YaaW (UPF0174 family)